MPFGVGCRPSPWDSHLRAAAPRIRTSRRPGLAAVSTLTIRLAPRSSGSMTRIVIERSSRSINASACRQLNAGTAWHPKSANSSPSHIRNPKSGSTMSARVEQEWVVTIEWVASSNRPWRRLPGLRCGIHARSRCWYWTSCRIRKAPAHPAICILLSVLAGSCADIAARTKSEACRLAVSRRT
jgi:hypothetical protein